MSERDDAQKVMRYDAERIVDEVIQERVDKAIYQLIGKRVKEATESLYDYVDNVVADIKTPNSPRGEVRYFGGSLIHNRQDSSSIDFTAAGHGAQATDLQTKNRQIRSVFDWMTAEQIADVIAGTLSIDVTSAIQSAVNAVLTTSGGGLYWPDGSYKLTAAITIPQVSRVRLFGASRGGVVLKQYTSATHIFSFSTCDSGHFEISGFTFDYSSAQTATSTAIYFAGTTGTPANGFYNFKVRDVRFTANCWRGLATNDGIQLSAWGFVMEDIESRGAGKMIYLNPNPSIGIPNISLYHCYIECSPLNEEAIDIHGVSCLTLKNVELNNGTIGGAGNPSQHVLLTNCDNVVIEASKEENATIASDSRPHWNFSSSHATLKGVEFIGVNVNAGLLGFCITADSTSSVSVDCMNAGHGTLGAGAVFAMLNSSGFNVLSDLHWNASPGSFVLYPGGKAVKHIRPSYPAADVGDASITVVAGTDPEIQVWNTALTADRTVTLSTVVTPTPGDRFLIIRTANATGAHNLNVGSGPLKALASAGTWCEVRYNGNTSAWMLAANGSL